jgi:glycosyltransferase involved in cell wall biosynthesis
MSIRVLHLIATFGTGGAERQLSILAPAMVDAGIECHVAYVKGGKNQSRLIGTGVYLYQISLHNLHNPYVIAELLLLIQRVKPHIVQTWLPYMDIMGGITAAILKVPRILTERSSTDAYPKNLKNWLRISIGMHADGIIANSNGGLEFWRMAGRCDGLSMIRNAITCDSYEGLEIPNQDSDFIIYAGRLSEEKNVMILLEALFKVVSNRPDIKVKMFGDGPLRTQLEHQISDLGMGKNIELPGFTEDLSLWMKTAKACISVSHFEGLPNVVLEAAKIGCPLVLSDIPAHREVLDEKSAWFTNKDDPTDISNRIYDALDDEKRSRHQAQMAKLDVQEYTLESVVQHYLTVYSQVHQSRFGKK